MVSGPMARLLEAFEIGEQLVIEESIRSSPVSAFMIEGAVSVLWRGPALPAVLLVDDELICFACEFCGFFLLLFDRQDISEKNPRGLLHVIQLRGAQREFDAAPAPSTLKHFEL